MHQRACAHRTRLFRHVHRTPFQTPVANGSLCGGEGYHLCVGGGVLERFYLVPAACYDLSLLHDDAAAGHFADAFRFGGLQQRLLHEMLVLGHASAAG